MSQVKLTETQKNVLRYIAKHISVLGYQPTYREIGKHFKWSSPCAARNHLVAMEKKGVVLISGESRAIRFQWRRWAKRKARGCA